MHCEKCLGLYRAALCRPETCWLSTSLKILCMRDGAWGKLRSWRKGRNQVFLGRGSPHFCQLSPDLLFLCLFLSCLPGSSSGAGNADRRQWESAAPLSSTHPGSEHGSPWVSDQCLKQSHCALPASHYQHKTVRNNRYCRIAHSPGGFDPNLNEVGGKTPIDFNRLYLRLLVCCCLLCC